MNHSSKNNSRLVFLDTLRGFDMLWIIGADLLIRNLAKVFPAMEPINQQLMHAKWQGLHMYDLIFPLFMFISGVAIPYSLIRKLESGVSKRELLLKVIKRAVILIVFGIIYNKGLSFENVRFASVLGQIGIAYLIAAIIVLNTSGIKRQLLWIGGILLFITALQHLVPVPGYGAGSLSPEGSVNGWIDRMLLPGRLYGKTFDPEGLLCCISASVLTLMGAVIGELIRSGKYSGQKNALIIFIAGATLLIIGLSLSPVYPIIKRIWTSTFNLAAGGISLMLAATFYYIIDVKKWWRSTLFLRVIGLNSITIYMLHRIVNFKVISIFFFEGLASLSGDFHAVVIFTGMLAIEWALLYFLYKKQIFLKV